MAFSAHVEKASRKGGTTRQGNRILNLGDLYRHNERVGNYANAENIHAHETVQNYSLDDFDPSMTYEERLDKVRDEYGITAKERSVAVASFIISASPEEMANMSKDKQKQFFKDVQEELNNHFGENALVYAQVHNDEKTPHMHIGYVPIDDTNGKNSIRWGDIQKDKETGQKIYRGPVHRDFLKYLQNDLPQKLIERGYPIEIGNKQSKKHVDTKEWREQQKELGRVRNQIEDMKKAAALKKQQDDEELVKKQKKLDERTKYIQTEFEKRNAYLKWQRQDINERYKKMSDELDEKRRAIAEEKKSLLLFKKAIKQDAEDLAKKRHRRLSQKDSLTVGKLYAGSNSNTKISVATNGNPFMQNVVKKLTSSGAQIGTIGDVKRTVRDNAYENGFGEDYDEVVNIEKRKIANLNQRMHGKKPEKSKAYDSGLSKG